AADPAVLVQAHIADAAMLVVAVPDPVRLRVIVQTARTLNPRVDVVLRTRSEEELQLLRRDVQGEIFNGEEVLAAAMTQRVLQLLQAPRRSASDARSAPA
ncbi:MAG TPA: NAD-binding protein, partial [Ideonella sp.]|nr:NAD-binding protein [Ideonella sp.]